MIPKVVRKATKGIRQFSVWQWWFIQSHRFIQPSTNALVQYLICNLHTGLLNKQAQGVTLMKGKINWGKTIQICWVRIYLVCHQAEQGFQDVQNLDQALCIGLTHPDDNPLQKKVHTRHDFPGESRQLGKKKVTSLDMLLKVLCKQGRPTNNSRYYCLLATKWCFKKSWETQV